MRQCNVSFRSAAIFLFVSVVFFSVYADNSFKKLLKEEKYQAAIDYADEKIAVGDRDAAVWNGIGDAYMHLENREKALACYLVSWRMNPENYTALYGVSRIYNLMKKYEDALSMAKKALEVNFTTDASWEYAQACIALGRAAEAKKAMEKVLEQDSSNVTIVSELAKIYFNEGAWSSAIPVLKLSFQKNGSGFLAYQIGKAYSELNVPDSTIRFMEMAKKRNGPETSINLILAKAYYDKKKFGKSAATYEMVAADSMTAADYYRYGCSTEKVSGLAASTDFFQKAAKKLNPDDKSKTALLIKEKLVQVHLTSKKFQEAEKVAEEIIAVDPAAKTVGNSYLLAAEVATELDKIDKGIAYLEKAISINSRNVEAYARLADLYQKSGKEEKAKKTFEVLLNLSPDDPNIYLALGSYYLNKKDYEQAESNFKKSSSLKKSAEASSGIASILYETKQYDEAVKVAREALKLDVAVDGARLVLAQALIKKLKYLEAQKQLEELLKKKQDSIEILQMLALCYEKSNLVKKLAEIDEKIRELDKSDSIARLRLAMYYEKTKNITKSVAVYRELQKITPKSPIVLRNLSRLLSDKGDTDEAIIVIRQYLDSKKNDAEAHRDLGDLYYKKKKLDDALLEYRTALKLDPAIKGFYKRYAEIVIAKGEQDEVIKALSGVAASGNADLSTYMTLGLMYEKKKKYTDAIDMYQKALILEPSNFDALVALANCQADKNEIKNAIISYEQAVMMNPKAVQEYKMLGDLYKKEKRDDEAVLAYVKYLDKDSSDRKLSQEVGEYYFTNSNTDKAYTYFRQAKDILTVKNAIRFAEIALKKREAEIAKEVLLPYRLNKKVNISDKKQLLRLIAEAFESDSELVAAAQWYGQYLAIKGVKDSDAAYKHAFFTEKSDPIASRKIYEKNCETYPDDFRNYLRLGFIYSEQKATIDKAIPLFKKVTLLADSFPEVWLELGMIYRKTGNEEEELNAYKKYVQTDPQNIEANSRIGTIQIRRGNYSEGIVVLEMVNTIKSDDPDIMALLAKGYLSTGRTDEAVSLLKKAKAAKKDDPEIRFELFKIYQKSGKKDEARKEMEELISIKREPEYLLLYSEALLMQKKKNDALQIIEEILATNPENIAALLLKGEILRKQKKYDEAIDVYKEINYIDAGNADAMVARAETHLAQSKPQWAESFFKRALRADPKNARAKLGLAKTEKLKGNIEGYKKHLEKARLLDPDDESVQLELKKK